MFWGYSEDPTGGALWYHADYVRPVWRKRLTKGPQIGRHLFYLPRGAQIATVQPIGAVRGAPALPNRATKAENGDKTI